MPPRTKAQAPKERICTSTFEIDSYNWHHLQVRHPPVPTKPWRFDKKVLFTLRHLVEMMPEVAFMALLAKPLGARVIIYNSKPALEIMSMLPDTASGLTCLKSSPESVLLWRWASLQRRYYPASSPRKSRSGKRKGERLADRSDGAMIWIRVLHEVAHLALPGAVNENEKYTEGWAINFALAVWGPYSWRTREVLLEYRGRVGDDVSVREKCAAPGAQVAPWLAHTARRLWRCIDSRDPGTIDRDRDQLRAERARRDAVRRRARKAQARVMEG